MQGKYKICIWIEFLYSSTFFIYLPTATCYQYLYDVIFRSSIKIYCFALAFNTITIKRWPISIINSITTNTYFSVLTYLSRLYHNHASTSLYMPVSCINRHKNKWKFSSPFLQDADTNLYKSIRTTYARCVKWIYTCFGTESPSGKK